MDVQNRMKSLEWIAWLPLLGCAMAIVGAIVLSMEGPTEAYLPTASARPPWS